MPQTDERRTNFDYMKLHGHRMARNDIEASKVKSSPTCINTYESFLSENIAHGSELLQNFFNITLTVSTPLVIVIKRVS